MNNSIYQKHRQLNKGLISISEWWDFIALENKDEVKEVVATSIKAQNRLQDYKRSFRFVNKIRSYVSLFLYTDVHAYEVVKVISDKCVEIRRLKATCTQQPKEFYPGGFSGHYADNHNQVWSFEQDQTAGIVKLRLGKKGWGLGKYRMMDQPYEHYDYNF